MFEGACEMIRRSWVMFEAPLYQSLVDVSHRYIAFDTDSYGDQSTKLRDDLGQPSSCLQIYRLHLGMIFIFTWTNG